MRNQHPPLYSRVLSLLAILGMFLSATMVAAEVDKRPLELKLGESEIIKTSSPVTRVSVANPDIAGYVTLSTKELYVMGKKPGFTTMIVWEEGKTDSTMLNILVSLNTADIKEQLFKFYPNEKIAVTTSDTGVILSGTVSGVEVMEQVLRLTRSYLPKAAEGETDAGASGHSGSGITNLLKIGNLQQVMLEVTFAEVSKNNGRDLQVGMGTDNTGDFSGSIGTGALGVSNFGTLAAQAAHSLLINFAGNTTSGSSTSTNAANIFINIEHFTAALQFLESEGLARTLAEPRLITQSGMEASFMAGGEFPVPVIGTTANTNTNTVEYKPFGVALKFTPVVMSDGKISLHVVPSVSNITGYSQTIAGPMPILNTRDLETTVELYDGQTLALAGLLQDNMRETVRKIPFLGDIPILGALFRSTGYTQEKTDLLIAVTPHLIKPVPEGSIKFPGGDIQMPDRYEFYLEGRLEGRRSDSDESAAKPHDFPPPPQAASQAGGLEGNFGYQPVKAD